MKLSEFLEDVGRPEESWALPRQMYVVSRSQEDSGVVDDFKGTECAGRIKRNGEEWSHSCRPLLLR
jgi:hypothetical protein